MSPVCIQASSAAKQACFSKQEKYREYMFSPSSLPARPRYSPPLPKKARRMRKERRENSIHQSFTVWTAATAKEEKRRIKIDPGLLRTEGRERRKHGPFLRRESIPLPLELTVLSRKKRGPPTCKETFFFASSALLLRN